MVSTLGKEGRFNILLFAPWMSGYDQTMKHYIMIFINFYLGQGDQALTKAIFFCVSMDDVRLIREQSGNLKKQMRGQRRKMDGL